MAREDGRQVCRAIERRGCKAGRGVRVGSGVRKSVGPSRVSDAKLQRRRGGGNCSEKGGRQSQREGGAALAAEKGVRHLQRRWGAAGALGGGSWGYGRLGRSPMGRVVMLALRVTDVTSEHASAGKIFARSTVSPPGGNPGPKCESVYGMEMLAPRTVVATSRS